jgi:hypothetical protein
MFAAPMKMRNVGVISRVMKMGSKRVGQARTAG